jgi:hypothetical protein
MPRPWRAARPNIIASIAQGCGHLLADVVEVSAEVDRGKNVQ